MFRPSLVVETIENIFAKTIPGTERLNVFEIRKRAQQMAGMEWELHPDIIRAACRFLVTCSILDTDFVETRTGKDEEVFFETRRETKKQRLVREQDPEEIRKDQERQTQSELQEKEGDIEETV